MTHNKQRLRANKPTVAAEEIDGEVVLVNFDTGHYYSLRATAADIWRALEVGLDVNEVANLFDDAVQAEVGSFIESLQAEGLMTVAEANGQSSGAPVEVGPYFAPKLERFEEMSEMLLYDPIHDVDDTGWPNLPANT